VDGSRCLAHTAFITGYGNDHTILHVFSVVPGF
jgi:hypothetical protein